MRDITTEVPTDDTVPGGVVLLVELLLYVRSYVLLDVELLQSLLSAVDGVLLHFLRHIRVLDHGSRLSHLSLSRHSRCTAPLTSHKSE